MKKVKIDVPEDEKPSAGGGDGGESNDKKSAGKKKDDNDNDNDDDDAGPSETDLIIRDGFPALRIPGTKFKPLMEGEEPIPRHKFWTSENVISFHPDHLESLRLDCETVFTARDKPDGQAYSAGQTFFLPANVKPRCALEGLAMMIFEKHVQHLEKGSYNPAQSGANWWTLVMDGDEDDNNNKKKKKSGNDENDDDDEEEGEEDEVGLHFDADYELEEQVSNMLLHPRVGTVTYLSDFGAPTVIFDQQSPPMDDIKKTTLEKGVSKAWVSHPQLGKHTAFDGRLLHGAPALYFPSRKELPDQPTAKKQKIVKKRYTVLVNVWLNHWVMDAALLDEEICAKLITPWEPEGTNLKGDDSYTPPFVWNEVDLSKPVTVEKTKLSPSNVDPAGEDEIALCNHNVTVKYNATMEECHKASALAPSVEIEFEEGAFTIHVGDELPDDSDGEGEGDD